jgi:hypothetical protein
VSSDTGVIRLATDGEGIEKHNEVRGGFLPVSAGLKAVSITPAGRKNDRTTSFVGRAADGAQRGGRHS